MFSSLVGLILTEDMSEFKSASELDDTIIQSIRKLWRESQSWCCRIMTVA